MSLRTGASVAVCIIALVVATSVRLVAEDSLTAARELYASAEYQQALTMLNGLRETNLPPQDRQAIELYRTFCLVAIGNTVEANQAVEAMITSDPLYRPNMDDVPPRLRNVFSDARRRLLPSLIQQKYVFAKAAFDRNEYKTASEAFTQVLIGLSDPDLGPAAGLPPLADLRVLAASFNDLTVRAMTPPRAPQIAPLAPTPEPPAAAATAAAARPPRPFYDGEDKNVLQPVVLRQEVPPFPGKVTTTKSGVVDVIIDETGAVTSAMIAESVDPVYDRIVLAAAKEWLYRPARLDSAPVKYKKRIQITLSPNSTSR